MLFLFNNRVIDVAMPEARLNQVWRTLGCGDPARLTAADAVDFVKRVIEQTGREGLADEDGLRGDLAALLIATTGANAATFLRGEDGQLEPRLSVFPEPVLEGLRGIGESDRERASALWVAAA